MVMMMAIQEAEKETEKEGERQTDRQGGGGGLTDRSTKYIYRQIWGRKKGKQMLIIDTNGECCRERNKPGEIRS